MVHTVLIVDDDPTQRRLMETSIGRMGYKTESANSGAVAIQILEDPENQHIKLVILDLVMPEMDGFKVLKRVHQDRPALPVIVLTSQGGIEMVVTAMKAGAVDFFVKPVSPERIKVGIKNALQLRALEGEIKRLSKRSASTSGGSTVTDITSANGATEVDNGAICAVDRTGHLRPLEEIEGEMIQLAIKTYSGHMSEIARRLGIGRSTLYRKIKVFGFNKQVS